MAAAPGSTGQSAFSRELNDLIDRTGGLRTEASIPAWLRLAETHTSWEGRLLLASVVARTRAQALRQSLARFKLSNGTDAFSVLRHWLEDGHRVPKVLTKLLELYRDIPIDREALRSSEIGKVANRLRKESDRGVAQAADNLVAAWKAAIASKEVAVEEDPGAVSDGSKRSRDEAVSDGAEGKRAKVQGDAEKSAAIDGQPRQTPQPAAGGQRRETSSEQRGGVAHHVGAPIQTREREVGDNSRGTPGAAPPPPASSKGRSCLVQRSNADVARPASPPHGTQGKSLLGNILGSINAGGFVFGAAARGPVRRVPRSRARRSAVRWRDEASPDGDKALASTRWFFKDDEPAKAREDAMPVGSSDPRVGQPVHHSGFASAARREHQEEFKLLQQVKAEHMDEERRFSQRLRDMRPTVPFLLPVEMPVSTEWEYAAGQESAELHAQTARCSRIPRFWHRGSSDGGDVLDLPDGSVDMPDQPAGGARESRSDEATPRRAPPRSSQGRDPAADGPAPPIVRSDHVPDLQAPSDVDLRNILANASEHKHPPQSQYMNISSWSASDAPDARTDVAHQRSVTVQGGVSDVDLASILEAAKSGSGQSNNGLERQARPWERAPWESSNPRPAPWE
ncbi:unnamed protein product [Pedinophyceae sp. YPF-701]|nr:unnamed protein product [Pedinophyceae sp. YPF-701]